MGYAPSKKKKILRIYKHDFNNHKLLKKWCYPVALEINYEMAHRQFRFRTMFMPKDGIYSFDLVLFEENIRDEEEIKNEVNAKNYKLLEYKKMIKQGLIENLEED